MAEQRVVAVEINVRAADKADGNIIVPFGLVFEPGITIQLDDGAPSAPFKVRTCEKPVSFSVPLKGFAPAYARAVADGQPGPFCGCRARPHPDDDPNAGGHISRSCAAET